MFALITTLNTKLAAGIGFDTVETIRTSAGIKKITDAPDFIESIILFVLSFLAVLALAALIWAGIKYIIALGDPGEVEKAKHIILYTIIGILVAGGAAVIVYAVGNIVAAP